MSTTYNIGYLDKQKFKYELLYNSPNANISYYSVDGNDFFELPFDSVEFGIAHTIVLVCNSSLSSYTTEIKDSAKFAYLEKSDNLSILVITLLKEDAKINIVASN